MFVAQVSLVVDPAFLGEIVTISFEIIVIGIAGGYYSALVMRRQYAPAVVNVEEIFGIKKPRIERPNRGYEDEVESVKVEKITPC